MKLLEKFRGEISACCRAGCNASCHVEAVRDSYLDEMVRRGFRFGA
jgi:hypothetical protein